MGEQNVADMGPETRAEMVARDLADRGLPVTARAVREAAGVRMAVAAEAARAWNEAAKEDQAVSIPPTPEDVRGRLDAIWADAYRAALALVTPERDRLTEEAEALRAEIDALTVTVTEVEVERDEITGQATQAAAELEEARATLVEANAATATAQARCADLEEERDRLTKQINALIEKLPNPKEKKSQAPRVKKAPQP